MTDFQDVIRQPSLAVQEITGCHVEMTSESMSTVEMTSESMSSCPPDEGERQLSGKARNTIPRISKFLHIERLQEGWDEEEAKTDHLREPIGFGTCISENRLGDLYNYFSRLSLSLLSLPPSPLSTHPLVP